MGIGGTAGLLLRRPLERGSGLLWRVRVVVVVPLAPGGGAANARQPLHDLVLQLMEGRTLLRRRQAGLEAGYDKDERRGCG